MRCGAAQSLIRIIRVNPRPLLLAYFVRLAGKDPKLKSPNSNWNIPDLVLFSLLGLLYIRCFFDVSFDLFILRMPPEPLRRGVKRFTAVSGKSLANSTHHRCVYRRCFR